MKEVPVGEDRTVETFDLGIPCALDNGEQGLKIFSEERKKKRELARIKKEELARHSNEEEQQNNESWKPSATMDWPAGETSPSGTVEVNEGKKDSVAVKEYSSREEEKKHPKNI